MSFRSSAGILVGAFGCSKTVVDVLHERTNRTISKVWAVEKMLWGQTEQQQYMVKKPGTRWKEFNRSKTKHLQATIIAFTQSYTPKTEKYKGEVYKIMQMNGFGWFGVRWVRLQPKGSIHIWLGWLKSFLSSKGRVGFLKGNEVWKHRLS